MMLDEEFHNRPDGPGYVYLMQGYRGQYKIGHSINPRKRRAQLSKKDRTVKIVLLIPTSDMIALELDLQRCYQWKRTRGEWYRLERADIQHIVQTWGAVRYNPDTFDWKAGIETAERP
jgi:hypothetical protein